MAPDFRKHFSARHPLASVGSLVLGLSCTVLVRSSSGSRHAVALIGIADGVQMLDFLLGRVRIEAASFAPRITRDLTLRQTIEAQVHNMLVRLSNALAQAGRSLRSGRPLSEVAAELPAAPTKPTDAEAPAP